MKKNDKFLLVVAVLLLATLACNLGVGRSEPTATPSPPAPQPVETLPETPSAEQIKVEITEEQLTSIVASEVQGQDDVPVQDPQVQLRDGQVRFLATVEQQPISLPAEVVMTVQPDATGGVKLDVLSAKIGPLPVPGDVTDELETSLNQALAQEVESRAPNTHIESIVIANGIMTIIGRAR